MLNAKTIFVFISCACLPLTLAAQEETQSTQAHLKMAEDSYNDMEYEDSLKHLEQAEQNHTLSREEKIIGYALRAKALAIMGESESARLAFLRLLELAPDYAMNPKESPKILFLFRSVQEERRKEVEQIALRVSPQTASTYPQGQPVTLPFKLDGDFTKVTIFNLYLRVVGQPTYQPLALQPVSSDIWQGTLSADWASTPTTHIIEYYPELFAQQYRIATPTTMASPASITLTIAAAAPLVSVSSKSFYQKSWFWWTTATLVGVATGFYIVESQNNAPNTPLGEVPMN